MIKPCYRRKLPPLNTNIWSRSLMGLPFNIKNIPLGSLIGWHFMTLKVTRSWRNKRTSSLLTRDRLMIRVQSPERQMHTTTKDLHPRGLHFNNSYHHESLFTCRLCGRRVNRGHQDPWLTSPTQKKSVMTVRWSVTRIACSPDFVAWPLANH